MNTTFERKQAQEVETLFGAETTAGKDEWLTPPEIIRALGSFDLDPCAPVKRPWEMAANHFTVLDNGLNKPWQGRVCVMRRLIIARSRLRIAATNL